MARFQGIPVDTPTISAPGPRFKGVPIDGGAQPAPINPRERAMEVLAKPAGEREMPSEAAMRSPLGNLPQSRSQSFGQGFADTGGMGFADEAGALIGSTLTGNSYGDVLKEMRDIRAGAQEQNPGSFLAGQVTGAVAPAVTGGAAPGILTGVARSGAGLGTRMGVGSAGGALTGGVYGFGSGEGAEDRLSGAVGGAVSGALIGGVAPALASAITGGVSKAAGVFNKKSQAAPSLDLLNRAKDVSYDAAEKAGIIIKPAGIDDVIAKVKSDFTKFGYRPKNQPGAAEALAALEEVAGKNVTLKGLDSIRKAAAGGYTEGINKNKTNNALIAKVIKHIDEMLESQNPALMAGINTPEGIRALQMARKFAHRASKLETAENLIKKGNQQADRNITDTRVKSVKSQLAKINDPFASWGRGFTAAEKAAAGKAASYTPTQRALHGLSVLNPFAGGKLSAGGHLAAGAANLATGNLPGLALQALGIGAGAGFQKAGEALARKSVDEFVDLVARGGIPAPVVQNALQRMVGAKRDLITRALISAGVKIIPDKLGLHELPGALLPSPTPQ